jgi:hypothetical protein
MSNGLVLDDDEHREAAAKMQGGPMFLRLRR